MQLNFNPFYLIKNDSKCYNVVRPQIVVNQFYACCEKVHNTKC